MRLKDVFVCSACGNQSLVWQGQCPACREWNTMAATQQPRRAARPEAPAEAGPRLLEDVQEGEQAARSTGFQELDRLLGQGMVPGGTILLGGEPGIGKSTLLLQLAGRLAEEGRRTVYISGEESLPQLRGRAERLGLLGRGLPAMATTSLEEALAVFAEGPAPELVIVDSVQTLSSGADGGLPGSVGQVRAVAASLTEQVKKGGSTLLLVGHVTKEGHLAGPKLLEHMVDTVLALEGDRRNFHRILRVLKNRFGPSDELVVLEMGRQGLSFVADPSTYFLGERDEGLPGSALVLAVEGRRPFVVEVQALVAGGSLSPRRTALGFDSGRLGLLLAVMEKHLGVQLGGSDVYCKIGGGLKLSDPGLDLGIVAAVLSSLHGRPLPAKGLFWGEVDLNGLVRPCGAHELRAKQAKRLGYGPLFFSRQGKAGGGTLAGFAQAVLG